MFDGYRIYEDTGGGWDNPGSSVAPGALPDSAILVGYEQAVLNGGTFESLVDGNNKIEAWLANASAGNIDATVSGSTLNINMSYNPTGALNQPPTAPTTKGTTI